MYTDALSSAAEKLAGTDTMARIDAAAAAVRADLTSRSVARAAPQPRPAGPGRPRPPRGPRPRRAAPTRQRQRPRRRAGLAAAHARRHALDIVGPLRGYPRSPPRCRRSAGRVPRRPRRTGHGDRRQIREQARSWTPATAPVWARPLAGQRRNCSPKSRCSAPPTTSTRPTPASPDPSSTPTAPRTSRPLLHQRLDAALVSGSRGAQTLAHPGRGHRPAHHRRPVLAAAGHPPRPSRPRRRRRHRPGRRRHGPPRCAARRTARRRPVVAPGRHAGPGHPGAANARLRPAWTTELHRILGSTAAETITADPAWPALVAAVNASDWAPGRPALRRRGIPARRARRRRDPPRRIRPAADLPRRTAHPLRRTTDRDIPHPAEGVGQTLAQEPPAPSTPAGTTPYPATTTTLRLRPRFETASVIWTSTRCSPSARPSPPTWTSTSPNCGRGVTPPKFAPVPPEAVLSARGGPAEQAAAALVVAAPPPCGAAPVPARACPRPRRLDQRRERLRGPAVPYEPVGKFIARAVHEGDRALAQAYRERRGDLTADAADLAAAVVRTRTERDAAPNSSNRRRRTPSGWYRRLHRSRCAIALSTPTSPHSTPPATTRARWKTSWAAPRPAPPAPSPTIPPAKLNRPTGRQRNVI